MCGRYFIDLALASEELREAIEALQRHGGEPVKTGEIRPGDRTVVVARSRSGKVRSFAMRWGFKPPKGRLVINARGETAASSPMFSESMIARRCLLPATAYFEWEKREAGKVKHEIMPEGLRGFYIAGLYRYEAGEPVFVVLTRDAAPDISHIHDRMPVLLAGGAARAWLNPRAAAQDVIAASLTGIAFREAEEGEA